MHSSFFPVKTCATMVPAPLMTVVTPLVSHYGTLPKPRDLSVPRFDSDHVILALDHSSEHVTCVLPRVMKETSQMVGKCVVKRWNREKEFVAQTRFFLLLLFSKDDQLLCCSFLQLCTVSTYEFRHGLLFGLF